MMEIKRRVEFNGNVIITREIVEKMISEIEVYCKAVYITAMTKDKTIKIFNDIDELFDYDNFKNSYIMALSITGNDYFPCIGIHIQCKKSILGVIERTIVADYFVDEKDMPMVEDKINKIFLGCEGKSSFIRKWISAVIYISVLFAFFYYDMREFGHIKLTDDFFTILTFPLFVMVLVTQITYYLVAPVRFMIGKRISYYNKLDSNKEKFFWGVLIAFAVGVLVNIVSNVKI